MMVADIVLRPNIIFSGSGKILRHMAKLRRRIDSMRAEKAEIESEARLQKEYISWELYPELINSYDNAIASGERELELLGKAVTTINATPKRNRRH